MQPNDYYRQIKKSFNYIYIYIYIYIYNLRMIENVVMIIIRFLQMNPLSALNNP